MLHLLDESLEAFLRTEVPLPAKEVDVSFAAPDRDWGAGVSKPTVNLYLWDVRRNAEEREAGMELVEQEDGRRFRRPPLPRVDCRYLVTAWTSEVGDEHALLGAVLAILLTRTEMAPEHLQGPYAPVRPVPSLSVAATDGKDQSDFWSALGGQLKPGLDLVVTATVDAALLAAAGPPVERYEVAIGDPAVAERRSRGVGVGGRVPDAAGATVRSPRGTALVAPDGSFLVRAHPGDTVTVETDDPYTAEVPDDGVVRFETG